MIITLGKLIITLNISEADIICYQVCKWSDGRDNFQLFVQTQIFFSFFNKLLEQIKLTKITDSQPYM